MKANYCVKINIYPRKLQEMQLKNVSGKVLTPLTYR